MFEVVLKGGCRVVAGILEVGLWWKGLMNGSGGGGLWVNGLRVLVWGVALRAMKETDGWPM